MVKPRKLKRETALPVSLPNKQWFVSSVFVIFLTYPYQVRSNVIAHNMQQMQSALWSCNERFQGCNNLHPAWPSKLWLQLQVTIFISISTQDTLTNPFRLSLMFQYLLHGSTTKDDLGRFQANVQTMVELKLIMLWTKTLKCIITEVICEHVLLQLRCALMNITINHDNNACSALWSIQKRFHLHVHA